MIRRLLRALAGSAALLAAGLAWAQQVPVPKLTGHVVDLTGTLAAPARDAIDAKLAGFERERGSQVAVLIVPTIGDETIEEFAGRVTDEWKLGRKGIDDGVLFVIAMKERRLRIAPGRGVSGSLTDALSKRIVSDLVAPYFKSGDFAGGVDAGVGAIMKSVEGEALALPKERPQAHGRSSGGGDNLFAVGIFGIFIVSLVMRTILGRFFGAAATSAIAAVGAWFVVGSIAIVVVAAVVAFIFTLVAGLGGGRGFVPGVGWGGGGFGGGGFSGGGGGFSGGGGSFDGGGASGSW